MARANDIEIRRKPEEGRRESEAGSGVKSAQTAGHGVTEPFPGQGEASRRWVEASRRPGRGALLAGSAPVLPGTVKSTAGKGAITAGRGNRLAGRGNPARGLGQMRISEINETIIGATFPTWGECPAAGGQRESVKVDYNNSDHLTAVNAVPSSWKEEKFEPVASGLLSSRQSPEISGEERSVKPQLEGNRFLAALEMTDVFGTRLLTIKYYNSPSRRIAGTTKNAHLSMLENRGTGDNKFFPFFLISSSSPLGEMSAGWRTRGKGKKGTVANINKTSAYET